MFRQLLMSLALVSATSAGPRAAAQPSCMLCGPDGRDAAPATPSDTPLQIEIGSGLDFDRVAPTAAAGGTVFLDPVNGTRTVSGALSSLGGLVMTGSATVRGEAGRPVRVILPMSVSLAGADGGSARISRLITDLPPSPRLGRDGSLRFAFGGTLEVSGDLDGDYRGRIPITVEYQ